MHPCHLHHPTQVTSFTLDTSNAVESRFVTLQAAQAQSDRGAPFQGIFLSLATREAKDKGTAASYIPGRSRAHLCPQSTLVPRL